MADDNQLVFPNPFYRGQWHGEVRTFDRAVTHDFEELDEDDVERIIAQFATPDQWDGYSCGIVLLRDGRYVSWHSFYGPTGDGFNEDAYGGNADVIISKSLSTALRYGLDEESRIALGYTLVYAGSEDHQIGDPDE